MNNPLNTNPALIKASRITHCFQKNPTMHNKRIKFLSTLNKIHFFPVRAKLRILESYKHLNWKENEPLAVFKRNKGSKRLNHYTKKTWRNG